MSTIETILVTLISVFGGFIIMMVAFITKMVFSKLDVIRDALQREAEARVKLFLKIEQLEKDQKAINERMTRLELRREVA